MPEKTIVNYTEESMIITFPNGAVETYQMTTIPDRDSGWVLAAKTEILHTMTLEGMLSDLGRAADLIYVAYNGVVGTGSLAASVSGKQKRLAELCAECVTVMQGFVQVTSDILMRLTEAYKWLLKTDEPRALLVLGRCAGAAEKMATSCGQLALKFKELKDETEKDSSTTEVKVGEENEQIKKLTLAREEMAASLKRQVQIQADLDAALEELNIQITDATAREDKESERAFITGIVGAVAGALSSGVSAYVTASNPAAALAGAAGAATRQPNAPASTAVPAAEPKPDPAQAEKLKADDIAAKQTALDAAKKELDEAETALTKATEDLKAKEQAVTEAADDKKDAATAERDSSKKISDTALATRDTAKKKWDSATSALEATKGKSSTDYLAAASGAGAAAGSIAASANTMADKAEARAESIKSERLNLINLKMQQQKEKRQAAASIAELNAKLGNNDSQTGLAQASLEALQIAVWAFNNIYVTLLNAQTFWNNLSAFCKRLGNGDLLTQVKDEAGDTGTSTTYSKEERREYYLSDMFMPSAIAYLARWAALNSICQDYVIAADRTYTKVTANIRSSPTIEEARNQLKNLKARYEQQSQEEEARFTQQNDVLMAERQKLLAQS